VNVGKPDSPGLGGRVGGRVAKRKKTLPGCIFKKEEGLGGGAHGKLRGECTERDRARPGSKKDIKGGK